MNLLILLAGSICAGTLASHVASVLAVIARFRRRDAGTPHTASASAGVSILRPVCGTENFIEETMRSTFVLDHPRYEILFCVLLALADIHRYDPVRQPGLLEKDRDLVAVRRRPIIEIDHRIPFLLARGGLSSASMFMAASERIRPIARRDRQACAASNNLPVSLAPLKCRLASDSIRGRYGDHALCYFRTRPVGAKPVEPAANNGHWRVARVEKEPKTRCATEKKAAPRARRCQ